MQAAEEALSAATFLLQKDYLRSAVNRAYYAMFHAVHAALIHSSVEPPRRHTGAINLFGRHFIITGILDRQLAQDLRDAYRLRQMSDYEVYASMDEDQIRDIVQKAQRFVAEIKRLIEGG